MKADWEATAASHSTVFSSFAYDLLEDILENAGNPARLNVQLVAQLRELTGARLVVLARRRDLKGGRRGYELAAVEPERRRPLAETPEMMALAGKTLDLEGPTIWKAGNVPPQVAGLLKETLPGPSVAVPLRVGDYHVGALLLFGLPHEHSLDQVIDMLATLSRVVALVFRNAALFADQETAIAARTRELRESEERLAVILRSIGDAVIATDLQGRVTFINPVAEGLTGWQEAEAQGRLIGEVFPIIDEETRQPAENPLARVMREGVVVGLANHTLLVARDGSEIPIADSGAPIRNGQGEITGMVLVFRDQTEERAAQKALQESEAKFRSVVESSPMGMHMYHLESDDRLIFVGANRAADRILGVDNSQFIGKTIEEAFPPLAATEVPERYRRAAAQGESWATDQITYEDEKIAGAFEVHAFQTEPGKMVAMFLDITDRKQAEQALRENEKLLQQMAANYPNSYISIIEKDLTIGFTAGQEFSKQNLDPTQFVGLTLEQVFGDQTAVVREHYKKTFKGEEQSFQLFINEQYQHYRTVPLYADDGSIPRILAVVENITERVRAEQLLRESEARYRILFEQANDGIHLANGHDEIIDANPRMCAMMGYSREELLAMRVSDLQAPEVRGPAGSVVRGEVARYGNTVFETLNVHRDGTRIPIEVSVSRVTGAEEELFVSVVRDITERKRTEQALRLTQFAVDNTMDAIYWMGPDAHFVYVNDAACKTLGYSREELLTMSVHDIDPEFPKEVWLAHWQEIRQRESFVFESIHQRKDGSVFPVEIAVNHIQFGDKEYNCAFARDITERKQAEEALQAKTRQQQSLIEAARHLTESLEVSKVLQRVAQHAKIILDAYGCAIYLLEEDGKTLTPVVAIEPGIEEQILATPLDVNVSLTGQGIRAWRGLIFNEIAEEEADVLYIPNTPMYEQERVLVVPFIIEDQVLGAMCLNRLGPLFTQEDLALAETFAAYASVALKNAHAHSRLRNEVEERVRAQEKLKEYSENLEQMVDERTQELRQAQEQLVRREKLAVLGQLAGGVAHELRNPLGVISNAIYYLKLVQPDADDSVHEFLDLIAAETQNAAKIVADLLDFTRTREPDRQPVDVHTLVADVLNRQPPPDNVTVTTDIPPDLPPAFVDPRQIGQVLANLISNAYQAMPDGGRLSVNSEQTGDGILDTGYWVLITVSDTGVGIPPEHMEKLFEPLFTTKARGIGLGLTTSKNLVEANGGSIEVQSQEGEGSTFTVILPTREAVP